MKNRLKYLSLFGSVGLLAACGGSDAPPPANDGADAPEEVVTETAEVPDPTADSTETLDGTVLADFTGDAANGETLFAQCVACHAVQAGENRFGPSLAGIIGSAAGAVEGFNYSSANAESGITWTPEKMFQYLESPRRVVPGTTMAYPGMSDPQDRADMIAYLQSGGE